MVVSVTPGATAFTRIPSRANSRASDLTRPMTPAFAAEYTDSPVVPTFPASEEVSTMLPPRLRMARADAAEM